MKKLYSSLTLVMYWLCRQLLVKQSTSRSKTCQSHHMNVNVEQELVAQRQLLQKQEFVHKYQTQTLELCKDLWIVSALLHWRTTHHLFHSLILYRSYCKEAWGIYLWRVIQGCWFLIQLGDSMKKIVDWYLHSCFCDAFRNLVWFLLSLPCLCSATLSFWPCRIPPVSLLYWRCAIVRELVLHR